MTRPLPARTLFLAAWGALLTVCVVTAQGRPMTPEDLWSMARPGAPQVSPDGRQAVVAVASYEIDSNETRGHLWLLDLESGERRQLTHHDKPASSPAWAPDGHRIAFTAARDTERAQLWVLPLDGGEARRITDLPVAVSSPQWLPDGRRVAFTASVKPGYGGDMARLKELLDEEKKSKVTARVTEDRIFRHWDRWLTEHRVTRLFVVDVESGEVVDLMPGLDRLVTTGGLDYDVSPDGATIAVSLSSSPPPYEYLNYDIYLVPTDGSGELRNLTAENPASDLRPRFTPDGRYLVYGRQTRTDFYADNVRLARHDLETGVTTVLTEDVDLSFAGWSLSPDGATIYAHAEDRGMSSIFALPLSGGQVRELHRGGTNTEPAATADGRVAFLHHAFAQPPEIVSAAATGGAPRRLTNFNDERVAEIAFGRVEDVTFPGANGTEVQMFVVYPPGFDPAQKWPLLVLVHGGPHGIFGDSFHFRWNAQLFAAPGYVTVLPNFHGSTSFGQAFTESIHGAHSELPFRDVMKGTDFMEARPYIDAQRTAAAGGSYGGYLVSWIAGQTDRYQALVNHAGVYNIMGQFASDLTYHRVAAYSGAPWEGLESMNRWNPALHAENFRTPMLVIHGERDYRVPITQGLEVYGVYKGKGLDARLVYYPDENHWILSPQNSIHWFGEVHGWLDRYLGRGPVPSQ